MMRLTLFALALAKYGEPPAPKDDLPSDANLRIGRFGEKRDCPERSRDGHRISVHYTGYTLKDGKKFDSSHDRDSPFEITLGQGQVIQGWENGLQGLCPGDKVRLTIPSAMGYGVAGSGSKIHGGATLIFDVEVMDLNEARK